MMADAFFSVVPGGGGAWVLLKHLLKFYTTCEFCMLSKKQYINLHNANYKVIIRPYNLLS